MMWTQVLLPVSNMKDFHSIERRDILFSALIFFSGLMLYIRTLAPGLLLGDSAEFQTLAYTLGMTHPTGYPVYIILAHWFTLLPIGEMAWRVNLFSAFWGALTLAFLYLILRIIIGRRIAAFSGPLILSVMPLFWIHSIVAELYAPASALISLIILTILMWRTTDHTCYLYAAALLGGLGLGVHGFIVFMLPGVLVYLVLKLKSRRAWLGSVVWAIFGVAFTLIAFYILDRTDTNAGYYHVTVRHALSAWNLTGADFDTPLERLKFLWFPRQFSANMFSSGQLFLAKNWQAYKDLLTKDLSWAGISLALLGVLGLARYKWKEFLLLVIIWGGQTIFVLNYKVRDFIVFFTPGFVFLTLFAGVGCGLVIHFVEWAIKPYSGARKFISFLPSFTGLLLFGVLMGGYFSTITDSWHTRRPIFLQNSANDLYPYLVDQPEMPHARATGLVNALEDNAIVFSDWNDVYSYYYVAYLEKNRPGMDFFEAYPQADELASSTADYISSNLGTRPIYFTVKPIGRQAKKFEFIPVSKDGQQLFEVIREK